MTGPVFFIKTPSLGDCQTIIKIESPAHEIETISHQSGIQDISMVFQVVLVDNEIHF